MHVLELGAAAIVAGDCHCIVIGISPHRHGIRQARKTRTNRGVDPTFIVFPITTFIHLVFFIFIYLFWYFDRSLLCTFYRSQHTHTHTILYTELFTCMAIGRVLGCISGFLLSIVSSLSLSPSPLYTYIQFDTNICLLPFMTDGISAFGKCNNTIGRKTQEPYGSTLLSLLNNLECVRVLVLARY